MRVAVSGADGRLGRALVSALEDAPFAGIAGPIAWTRTEFDLDRPLDIEGLIERDRPEVVIHAAAWTDVDGCARDPGLALARNGLATEQLALTCASRSIDLVVISTNEVFGGGRLDHHGYGPLDLPDPPNPYGASKLAGERGARRAYAGANTRAQLATVRTSWLFGPGKPDFPAKILAAAERAAAAGETLRAVG
ncbi:MAG TPA: sugar nucleotide-binding protein, partial [Candidatus Limnocylindrales bacterium]